MLGFFYLCFLSVFFIDLMFFISEYIIPIFEFSNNNFCSIILFFFFLEKISLLGSDNMFAPNESYQT